MPEHPIDARIALALERIATALEARNAASVPVPVIENVDASNLAGVEELLARHRRLGVGPGRCPCGKVVNIAPLSVASTYPPEEIGFGYACSCGARLPFGQAHQCPK